MWTSFCLSWVNIAFILKYNNLVVQRIFPESNISISHELVEQTLAAKTGTRPFCFMGNLAVFLYSFPFFHSIACRQIRHCNSLMCPFFERFHIFLPFLISSRPYEVHLEQWKKMWKSHEEYEINIATLPCVPSSVLMSFCFLFCSEVFWISLWIMQNDEKLEITWRIFNKHIS